MTKVIGNDKKLKGNPGKGVDHTKKAGEGWAPGEGKARGAHRKPLAEVIL
jgi:hypothetical protein